MTEYQHGKRPDEKTTVATPNPKQQRTVEPQPQDKNRRYHITDNMPHAEEETPEDQAPITAEQTHDEEENRAFLDKDLPLPLPPDQP